MSKVNYQTELDIIIAGLGGRRPKLMLHSCCGPCSSYVLAYLQEFFDITVFYYNPNIFPDTEYEHRLSEQKRLIEEMGGSIRVIDLPYIHEEFTGFIRGLEKEKEGGARCGQCFRLRLKKTLEIAKQENAEFFGTTLTVSPHKNAELINSIGRELETGVKWLPSDFKKKEGYKQSIELSKKYDLYRQDYCGCEFAHIERN